MSDASTMISDSIIERVDMSQFYGSSSHSAEFICSLIFNDKHYQGKILGYKQTHAYRQIILSCSQFVAAEFMGNNTLTELTILKDDNTIYTATQLSAATIDIDITHLQDLNCNIKLTIH